MLFNKIKNLLSAKLIIYEYALPATEVKDCLFQLFKSRNELHWEYDIIGGFVSEMEFKFDLITVADTDGFKITFPMFGTIIPLDAERSQIVLQIQSKFYAVLLLSFLGLLATVSLLLFFTNGEFKFLYWFTGVIIIGPFLLNSYVNAVSSALKLRYKKYLHNALLEAYRKKYYPI